MCDWGGNLVGRKGGWPNPMSSKEPESKLQVLPYFDTASLLKGTKARIFAEIGLIDNTCPSTSVYAALNQAKGEKTIIPIPYLGHTDVPAYYQKTWKENVEKKKLEFIADFLK
jgi:cephalosporin-C deacetylase-like acetyl esterase